MQHSYYLRPFLFSGTSINSQFSDEIKKFKIKQYSKLNVIFHTTYILCFQVYMSINSQVMKSKNSKLNNKANYMSFFILLTPFVFSGMSINSQVMK